METTWVKCSKCDGKGYHHNEHLGSYMCALCDGVGKFEAPVLPDDGPGDFADDADPELVGFDG